MKKMLEDVDFGMYMGQLKEFRVAESEGKRLNKRFKLIDVTKAIVLRGDGEEDRVFVWRKREKKKK